MHDDEATSSEEGAPAFVDLIGGSVQRKLAAKAHAADPVWSGLGMAGLVGWSVSVPTLLGVMLGIWVDHHHSGSHSWTLALLVAGLMLGCGNAWHWLRRQAAAGEQDGTRPHA